MEIRAEDGWRPCVGSSRPRHEDRKAMAEFVRAEWSEPFRSTWDDLPAATNIIGLYWRPVDPTREVSYDLSIHNNPNAMAWAKFFCESHPNCGLDEGTMVGWFANAMMAMHDHILKIGPLNGDHAQFLMDQERAT